MNLDIGRLLGTGAAPVTQDVTTGHLGSSSVINNPNPTALFQDSGNTIVSPNHILTPYLPPLACLLEARALVEAKVEVTWPSSYIYDDAVHKYCLQSLKRPTPPGIHREISPSGLVLEVGNIDLTVTMCIPQEAGGWPRPHRFWVIPRPPGDTSGTEVIIGQDHPMVVNLTTQSGLMQGEVNNFFGGPSGQQSMGTSQRFCIPLLPLGTNGSQGTALVLEVVWLKILARRTFLRITCPCLVHLPAR